MGVEINFVPDHLQFAPPTPGSFLATWYLLAAAPSLWDG